MNAGYGLTVRWSLESADAGVGQKLRDYVIGTSMAKFMFLDGLAFKTWRMSEGSWFEGTYVFDEAVYRDDFQREFATDELKLQRAGFRRGPGPGTA